MGQVRECAERSVNATVNAGKNQMPLTEKRAQTHEVPMKESPATDFNVASFYTHLPGIVSEVCTSDLCVRLAPQVLLPE